MRFIHTADWQLGARFSQFGEKAEELRKIRLATLRRTLERCRCESVDAFLIAGDLFEDNQVEETLVLETFSLFGEFADVPAFILPGNHDPLSGPGCIWLRAPFSEPPPHVTILRENRAYPFGDGWLVSAPIIQKKSTRDPSLRMGELVKGLEGTGPRIGVTHGSPAIESKHQPDDHPIHLEAATRAGLDYLALGHWHRRQVFDGGRMVMPGTPEPDAFNSPQAGGPVANSDEKGGAALVEISSAGESPRIQWINTAMLQWVRLEVSLLEAESARADLDELLSTGTGDFGKTVLRVVLRGTPANDVREDVLEWLRERLGGFFISMIDDRTAPSLSCAEREALRRESPLIARVLSDLDAVEALVSGRSGSDGPDGSGAAGLSLKDLEAICAERKQDWREFDDAYFRTVRQVLHRELREVSS